MAARSRRPAAPLTSASRGAVSRDGRPALGVPPERRRLEIPTSAWQAVGGAFPYGGVSLQICYFRWRFGGLWIAANAGDFGRVSGTNPERDACGAQPCNRWAAAATSVQNRCGLVLPAILGSSPVSPTLRNPRRSAGFVVFGGRRATNVPPIARTAVASGRSVGWPSLQQALTESSGLPPDGCADRGQRPGTA
jgi:hypothetical protein